MARALPLLAALVALIALAAAPVAAAQEAPPAAGSTQVCVPVSGGLLIEINGFGSRFPANTTGTTTFTFANGDVVSLEATTNFEGIFHTAKFALDLRDPADAALVGTWVHEYANFACAESHLDFQIYPCDPIAPDSRTACIDGGFESYPEFGFRNQGDCISWIATNGSNEPGQNTP